MNSRQIFADWIALNNGSSHGLEASGTGIQVELTAEIHKHLEPYGVSGAQHGTSGNNSEKLRAITRQTHTTKANVATALQMVSWGLEVNDYGNAMQDMMVILLRYLVKVCLTSCGKKWLFMQVSRDGKVVIIKN
jgi:fructose-bisphosphate aldolase class II